MKKLVTILSMTLFLLAGCSDPDNALEDAQNTPDTQPIHYETEAERKERQGVRDKTIGEQGGYIQSKRPDLKQIDRSKEYTDSYTNDEALLLMQELNKLDYLAAVEVASSDDKIMIGVMLNENDNHKQISDEQFADRIKHEVKKIIPDTKKEIIVFTEESEWGEWKNLDSRFQSPE